MKYVTLILILLFCSCEYKENKIPKEKFYRGNLVTMKLDGKKGIVVDKIFHPANSCERTTDWRYTIKFPAINPVVNNAYTTCDVYEFELVEPKPEKEQTDEKKL